MLTPNQVRAARGLLQMRVEELATATGISVPTLRGFEAGTRATMPANIRVLRLTLEEAGALFIDADGEHGPGVRLRSTGGKP